VANGIAGSSSTSSGHTANIDPLCHRQLDGALHRVTRSPRSLNHELLAVPARLIIEIVERGFRGLWTAKGTHPRYCCQSRKVSFDRRR
jgi:hypothetical protein